MKAYHVPFRGPAVVMNTEHSLFNFYYLAETPCVNCVLCIYEATLVVVIVVVVLLKDFKLFVKGHIFDLDLLYKFIWNVSHC